MKNFKDLVSEVAEPKAPEEKRFKDQHAIEVIPHPVALDHQFTGDIEGVTPTKLPADKADDTKDYDKAYKTKDDTGAKLESAESNRKSITEILGVNAKKKEDKKDDEDMEEAMEASCGCGPDCGHCAGKHAASEIGETCSCCDNKIEAIKEGGCSSTLKAEKKPAKQAEKKESDTKAADTLEKQVKPKPSQVTIKDSNGKTISLTFKEMLDKVSTEDELLESPQQEIPMMMKQLHFVCYAAEEIGDYLKTEGQDPEEWWQNKLAEVFSNVKSLYAYAKGDQMVNAKPMSAAKKFAKAGMAFEEIEAGSFELTNKESVQISEEDASILNTVFEHLNETNSTEMYSVLIADEAGYNEILSFAKENV